MKSIFLLTYGNGSSLAVDVVQRQIVRCAANPGEEMRIRAIAAIEPSQVSEASNDCRNAQVRSLMVENPAETMMPRRKLP